VRGDYLIRSSSRVVDPEPAADAFSVRTRGERGDIECLELARVGDGIFLIWEAVGVRVEGVSRCVGIT
jgi:hypothetical protein